MIDPRGRKFLVTGGTGFIGSALVRGLVRRGAQVRCLDNNSRGSDGQLGDVRQPGRARHRRHPRSGDRASGRTPRDGHRLPSRVHQRHRVLLRPKPELILEVAVKGMMNVLDACVAEGVRDLVAGVELGGRTRAPPAFRPTEDVPLVVPDVSEPALFLRRRQDHQRAAGGQLRAQVLRPRRPSSGRTTSTGRTWGRSTSSRSSRCGMKGCAAPVPRAIVPFPIQGTGRGDAVLHLHRRLHRRPAACHRARRASRHLSHRHDGRGVDRPRWRTWSRRRSDGKSRWCRAPAAAGSTPRRCPDIAKLGALGFAPATSPRGRRSGERWPGTATACLV